MNWKKGGLWIIIFFIVKGTISTLLIVTGAKYFNLSSMQILVLILILLLISVIGRKLLYRYKQNKKTKRAKYIMKPQKPLDFWGFTYKNL
nr:hypothetical protein [Bacillus cereus]